MACVDSRQCGESIPYFLRLAEITDGRAETIEAKIISTNINMERIIGFGCDGASNMAGRHSGVNARLKQLLPELVSIHCYAHGVVLAASQSTGNIHKCTIS